MKTSHQESSSDPTVHCENVKRDIDSLIDHLRKDVERVDDPQFKALCETGAEVLGGLRKAFEHCESAWRGTTRA